MKKYNRQSLNIKIDLPNQTWSITAFGSFKKLIWMIEAQFDNI